MSMEEINFCHNLRHLRKVHNMTQKEMAQIMGVSTATLGRIERCSENVRINCMMLCRICDRFQISADEILLENWLKMPKK